MKIKVKKTLILICYIRKMKKQFSNLGDPTIEQRNEKTKLTLMTYPEEIIMRFRHWLTQRLPKARKKWTLFSTKTVIIHKLCLFLKKREH